MTMDMQTSDAGPSIRRSKSVSSSGSSDFGGFGLDDIMPEPESPLPAPFSFAGFDIPDDITLPESALGAVQTLGGAKLVTRLVGSHPLWAHHLWNTSIVLSTFLLRTPSMTRGKRIAELGAGAALPSIVSALGGAAQVTVTDYPDEELIRNMAYNLDCNLGTSREKAVAMGHVWGANVSPLLDLIPGHRYDLLYLSDLVFNHSQHAALIKSSEALLSEDLAPEPTESDPYPTPCILVWITHHRPRFIDADLAFFPRLAQGLWAYEKVVEHYAGAMFPEDPGEERVRGTVRGWRCWRVATAEEAGERPDRVVEL